jgi:hypothetical protein
MQKARRIKLTRKRDDNHTGLLQKTDWRRYVLIVRMPVAGRHEDAVPEACFAVKPRAENFSGYGASIKLLRQRESYGEHY